MHPGRLISALLLLAALAPGTWLRDQGVRRGWGAPVTMAELPVQPSRQGPLRLEGGWRLASDDPRFGGYSALIVQPDGLFAIGDGAHGLEIALDRDAPSSANVRQFLRSIRLDKKLFDFESVTVDPETGQSWIGVENANALLRLRPDMTIDRRIRPPAMRRWASNGGPEAIVRLRDGRFVVLQETPEGWFDLTRHGLVFAGDPTARQTPPPFAFTLAASEGFSPVDMAQLPDGRVLVLLRRLTFPFPPRFASKLAIGRPEEIEPGKPWPLQDVARFGVDWPIDNFEGLAIEPLDGGAARLWIISDDNQMDHFQHTLLLRLLWDPGHAKRARGPAARP